MTIEEKIAILKGQIKTLCFKCADTPSTDKESIITLINTITFHKKELCALLKQKEYELSNKINILNISLDTNRIMEI